MKNKIFIFIAGVLLFSCSKEQEFNDFQYENVNSVSALFNKDVLLVHSNKLNGSNGEEGMEYDEETGKIVISKQSSEEVGYILKEKQIISVDLDTSAILRQIISIDTIAGNIFLETINADLEDVFREAEFELDSEFDPEINLKSTSSQSEINAALCDGLKIRPARVIYHTPEGMYIESVFKDEQLKGATMVNGEAVKSINFTYNMTNFDLYKFNGTNVNAKLTVEEAHITLGSKFVLATSIRRGKLKALRFQVKPSVSTHVKSKLSSTGAYSRSATRKIKSKAYSKTFVYYLGGVLVISVKIDADIYAAFNFDVKSSMDATSGFYASVWADLGARWTSNGWSPIRSFGHSEGVYPLEYNANATSDLRVELYPKVTAYICGVNGVSMDIVPYINNHIGVSTGVNGTTYDANLTFGLDTRIYARIKIAKKTLASYSSGNIQIISPKILWP